MVKNSSVSEEFVFVEVESEQEENENGNENVQHRNENETATPRKRSLVNVYPQPVLKERQTNKVAKRQNKEPSEKALRFLGADKEQVLRSKALKQLGLTEQDMYLAKPLFSSYEQQNRTKKAFAKRFTPKVVRITGMTEEQILRQKALRVLGVTETEIENEREKRLAAIGQHDFPKENHSVLQTCVNIHTPGTSFGTNVPKWTKIFKALRAF